MKRFKNFKGDKAIIEQVYFFYHSSTVNQMPTALLMYCILLDYPNSYCIARGKDVDIFLVDLSESRKADKSDSYPTPQCTSIFTFRNYRDLPRNFKIYSLKINPLKPHSFFCTTSNGKLHHDGWSIDWIMFLGIFVFEIQPFYTPFAVFHPSFMTKSSVALIQSNSRGDKFPRPFNDDTILKIQSAETNQASYPNLMYLSISENTLKCTLFDPMSILKSEVSPWGPTLCHYFLFDRPHSCTTAQRLLCILWIKLIIGMVSGSFVLPCSKYFLH